MPNSGRYPCGNCNYVAASRRMLSRHTAIAHAAQAFKCPLCPFVSCYQANLYRHKRDIHGLGRMTACEICGFFSSSVEELIEHKENNHQDQIEWLKKKYANERLRLGVETREDADVKSTDGENATSVEKETEVTETDCKPSEKHESTEDLDQNADEVLNKLNDTSSEMKTGQLGPIKIRRSYTCDECGLTTIDPRVYLYHRRDVHGEKMTVHECKHCIYASRHVQKLQRHCALVHREQMQVKKNTPNNNAEIMNSVKDNAVSKVIDDVVENWKCVTTDEIDTNSVTTEKQLTARKTMPVKLLKCSECSFQAYNSQHLIEHEKEVHRRKKDYECVQCGYDTNNKSRFTRHLKYHDVPKLKCNFCDFKTPYKWNMDRHLRNHVENGEYECNKCSFKTHAKQSLTVHLDYHHGNTSFNSKAKRPRLQTARKQALDREHHETLDEFYSNNVAFNDYIDDEEEDNGDDSGLLDDNIGNDATAENVLQKDPYLFQLNTEKNVQKQYSYGSSKQHSCPICDAKFSQLSWLGQHLKEGHPENADANNIAAVVDMLSPQRHKIRESPSSTPPLPGRLTISRKPHLQNKDKSVPTCQICGYKTRWQSELLKHERVHSGEKPFECHICEYKCKWKGDLTRHLQKFHKKRQQVTPNVNTSVEDDSAFIVPNHKQMYSSDGSKSENSCSSTPVSFSNDQDSPLDLTVTKKSPELVLLPALLGNVDKSVNNFHFEKEKPRFSPKQNSFPVKRQLEEYEVINEPPSKIIKKYKCTFCGFMTRTASRFHVHMVQHFDRRPFVCSACGYRSNWQWDITKHIKMKSARDDNHANATLVITDQTGEKNYEKYKSYLVDVEEKKETKRMMRVSNRVEKQFQYKDDDDDDNNCDMTSTIDEPENIVVTPDLPFSFEDPNQSRPATLSANEDQVLEPYQSRPVLNNSVVNEPTFERYKLFHCKHCSYKHREKKVVVSHLAVHAGIKLFRCRVCGVSSNWKNVILRHVKTHHSGQLKYVEELITYSVEGHVVCLTGIKKQQENVDSPPLPSLRKDTTRRCTICPYTCLKENHFQFHMKQHQPRDGTCFKCMFCPYYVKFRKTLVRHLELHKNESSEKTAQNLEEENTDPAELFMNENCDIELSIDVQNQQKTTNNWSYVEKQSNCQGNFYIKEKRHSCEQCPYKTDNKTQYLYHKQFHRPNKSAKFKCKLCSYWATHHHLIAQHLKVHNTEQPFLPVDVQSNKFVHSSQEIEDNQCVETPADDNENRQIRSVVVKRGDFYFRMFKCNYCPMMNKRRANVRVHEKMHSKSKVSKYVCPLCNYKCNNQGIITAHMKIHGNNSESFVSSYNNITSTTQNLADDANQSPPLKRKRVFSYFCMRCPAVFKSTADLEIHKTFHGMSFPLPCPHCDYRARNKAHLHKHLLVHTPEYVAKREASYGPPVVATLPEPNYFTKSSEANQMLLLEDAEMKAVMEGSMVHIPQKLHRCTDCPAAFFKVTTLQYHLSLHGSNGLYLCSQCNYAVDRNENLVNHEKFHISPPTVVKPKVPTMVFSCSKCPAIFDKVNRYNRHLQLHGQKNKYTCNQCDYSVRLPANLFNHKIVHTKEYAERKLDVSFVPQEASALGFTVSLERKDSDDAQKKRSFVCDRCPYFYMRKDAVQRHQRRHNFGGGMSCPYCDYNSLQLSFLRDHLRVHFQSESPLQAQAFMKHENYEIWSVEDGKREMLFKDSGASEGDRFFPPLDKELEDLYEAEGDALIDLSSVECKGMDDIPNKNVPVVDPTIFNANFEQLSALQGISESSSHQSTLNSDEKNDLIEDALNQSKKLEVILTDVFSGGNKAVIMNAMKNETNTEELGIEQEGLLEERNLVWENTKPVSPMLINLEDATTRIEKKSKPFAIEHSDYEAEGTIFNPTGLKCDIISSSAPVSSYTSDKNNVFQNNSETPIVEEAYGISLNNSSTIKEELFTGTNSFDVAEDKETELSSCSDYFDTEKTEVISNSDPATKEVGQKTENINSLDIITDVISYGCDNITDAEVTVTSDDKQNVGERMLLDTATLEKCHRSGLVSEDVSIVLPDSLLPM